MILTNCAACAAPLPRPAKQCSRCKTLYCGPACQRQHWERGGHDALCKKIKKGGGAEQYHADKKCKEAVAVAVEACADDTKGQTCYICLEAVHPRTGEGLVRGCACGDRDGVASGSTGVVHVSCLAEQTKILCDSAYKRARRWPTPGYWPLEKLRRRSSPFPAWIWSTSSSTILLFLPSVFWCSGRARRWRSRGCCSFISTNSELSMNINNYTAHSRPPAGAAG